MRVRGLKLESTYRICQRRQVAPHAGAWIEMARQARIFLSKAVAPHAGAWIEIPGKLQFVARINVAPHAGAWIEIANSKAIVKIQSSHPMRVRGLKSFAPQPNRRYP